MERSPHNTWRTGLDRILLGVAMSGDDHRHLGRGLPLFSEVAQPRRLHRVATTAFPGGIVADVLRPAA